ncbi:serine hydrolase domain-containing protein [Micromonospora zamorensis]|uniref:serine hydrolase domain-containing protein n=1 Tax=Micromonospora zamorensis TaxID=709883 RepID=UPI003D9925A4
MRRTAVITIVVALIAGLAGIALMPRVARLGAQTTGDADLAGAARAAVRDPSGHRGLAVALVENGRIRTAGLGDRDRTGQPVEPGTSFEIGSVTKALTGMLLADQAAAGVVRPDDPLGATWPTVTGPARDVTLAELASHRAGLPRLAPDGILGWARILWSNVSGGNPYAGQDTDAVRSAAGRVTPDDDERGEVHYSNLGPSVLGHALAARAGVAYADLLRARLLQPLGMDATVIATHADDLPAGRAHGGRASGRPLDTWSGVGYAPAGVGPWSTAEDLGRLAAATLAGTAPGADATTARFREDGNTHIGYGWFTTRHGDHEVVWHNGATGGFRSYIGLERATGRAVVVLGNTDKGVEPIGLRLLGVPEKEAEEAAPVAPVWIGAGLAVAFTFLGGLSLLGTARRRELDRVTVVAAVVWAFAYLGLAHRMGDWSVVPVWVWPLGAGLSAAGAALAVTRWSALPVVDARVPWRRLLSVASSLLAAVLAVAAVSD